MSGPWKAIRFDPESVNRFDMKNEAGLDAHVVSKPDGMCVHSADYDQLLELTRMVSVKKRLPEPGTLCIVFNGSYGVCWYKAINSVHEWSDEGEKWWNVTHWSLPPRMFQRG